jgi:hypothetical protein
MTDYLITNSAALIGGVEDASVSGSFDPAYASHALRFSHSQEAALTLPGIPDVWIHATCYYDDFSLTTAGVGSFWTVGVPNANVAQVKRNAAVKTLNYAGLYDTGPNSIGPALDALPSAVRFTLDVHLETGIAIAGNANDHRCSVYINGTLRGQVLGRANAVAGGKPVKFAFGGTSFLGGAARFFLSNILVSNLDTRGRQFRILRPTGLGSLATGVGGYAELGDSDPATFAYARAAGDAVTSTLTPGAASPGTIGRLRLVTYARNAVEAPNPALVVNRLRLGGTDYDAAPQAPAGATITALTSDWALNPATGLPWTWSDLASLEIGFMGTN